MEHQTRPDTAVFQNVTLPGVHLNFQMLGFVLQDRTVVCWLNVADYSEKRKDFTPS